MTKAEIRVLVEQRLDEVERVFELVLLDLGVDARELRLDAGIGVGGCGAPLLPGTGSAGPTATSVSSTPPKATRRISRRVPAGSAICRRCES